MLLKMSVLPVIALVLLIVLPVDQLITMLMPLIVFGATWLVGYIAPKIPGIFILAIVGVLSAVLGWVGQLIVPDLSWLQSFLFNLLAVVVNELIVQFKKLPADKGQIS